MSASIQATIPERPPVHLSELEFDALSALADALRNSQPAVSDMLTEELGRAHVHVVGELPSGTIRMGSKVRFVDERTGVERAVQIVFPHQADIMHDKISVGTPVGAALIGLKVGDRITCHFHDGHQRHLEILTVE